MWGLSSQNLAANAATGESELSAARAETLSAVDQDELAEAQAFLAEKNYEAAIEKFEAILERTPKLFAARMGIAKAFYDSGAASSAVFHLVKAEKIEPDNLELNEMLGNAFSRAGNEKANNQVDPAAEFEEAINSFNRAAKLDPKAQRFPNFVGWLQVQLGRNELAAEAYLRAAALTPKETKYLQLAADNYGSAGKIKKAEKVIDRALGLAPTDATLLTSKAQLREKAEDLKGATKFYVAALSSKMNNDTATSNSAQGLYRVHEAKGDWKGFADHIKDWVKARPASAHAHWWVAFSQLKIENYKGALEAAKRGEKIGGWIAPKALMQQGQALKKLGKIDEALEAFSKAALHPQASWTEPGKGPVFEMQSIVGAKFGGGALKEAIDVSEKWLLPASKLPRDRCVVQQDLGFFLRDYAASIDASGRSKKSQAMFKKSRMYYNNAIDLIPEAGNQISVDLRAALHNDCGLMYQYYDLRDYDTAVSHYEKALSYVDNLDDSLLNWGKIHIENKRYDEAIELLSRGSRGDVLAQLRRAKRLKKNKK